ncbi:ABC transporter permease [Clostridium thermarum]|uniref:ABC transporter permease n=1 Tax=Clostridium thermarum TaxID=1716543 RepID=UPI003C12B823
MNWIDWMVALLAAAVVSGTPILFATLGEIIIEKVGHLNLGVEGLMLMGAVVGFTVGLNTSSPVLAVLAAMVIGAVGGLIYAFLTVTLRANHTVTGLTLTTFGTGLSSFMGKKLVGQTTPEVIKTFFNEYPIPLLSKIPVLGRVFFNHDIFVYAGYLTAIAVGIYLYKTSKGLNLRAIGENPGCADAASVNISLYKYVHILAGCALCAIGGAYLSLVYIDTYQENVVMGRGWIAIALVIFAAWNPYKALIGAYLFGGLGILGFRLQSAGMHGISQSLVDMLPYLVTIVILVMVSMKKSKKNSPPKALGIAYFREER